MWKEEVIEVRNRSETKGPRFYIFLMASGGFNPNNDDVTLHKGSVSYPLTQTEVPIDIQTSEGR